MSSRQRIRTTCPRCGAVEVSFSDAAVVVTSESLRIEYQCPTCSTPQTWPLDRATSRLLTNAGLPVAVSGSALPVHRRGAHRST